MLPPILEVYVVWHPDDDAGRAVAEELVEHFHGTAFSGLIGGAVEVYVRSVGWQGDCNAPRPIPFADHDLPNGIRRALFVAVVPLVGTELARAVQPGDGPWFDYVAAVVAAHKAAPGKVGVFPYCLSQDAQDALDGTVLGDQVGRFQRIAAGTVNEGDSEKTLRSRDLTQGIAQLMSPRPNPRLRVFISHTKHHSPGEEKEDVAALIDDVRSVVGQTRLQEFIDTRDLQPGGDWDGELRENAATSALLAIRTDLYPSRKWCQREVLVAKRAGMPVIIADALSGAEERGSFLMDHVPRIPMRMSGGGWRRAGIYSALNLLVDESLKRIVWGHQESAAGDEIELPIAWWAPHAPEPITLSRWLVVARERGELPAEGSLIVLHPDPPLGPDEKTVLQELVSLSVVDLELDIMTPRMLAARTG